MLKPAPVLLVALAFAACDSPKPIAKTEAPPAPVRNDTLLLPSTNQINTRVVPDHLLDEPKLPGGTLGDYESKGRKYQLFVIRADSNQAAALLLLDLKNTMNDARFIAHMGGYAGNHNGTPVYAFAKLQFLAGVAGLDDKDADNIARQLAGKLH